MWSATLQWLKLLLTPAVAPEVISRDVLAIEIIVKRYREAWNKLESFAKAHNTEMYLIAIETSFSDVWRDANHYQFPFPGGTELSLLDAIIAQGRARYIDNPMCTITSAEAEILRELSVATDGLDLIYEKIVEKRTEALVTQQQLQQSQEKLAKDVPKVQTECDEIGALLNSCMAATEELLGTIETRWLPNSPRTHSMGRSRG